MSISWQVFFRAGVLGTMEELRDERLSQIVTWIQGWVRGFIARKEYNRLIKQREALVVVQRNIRKFVKLNTWVWFNLWQKVKPLINQPRLDDIIRKLEERAGKATELLDAELKQCQELETANTTLAEEKNNLITEMESTRGNMSQYIEQQSKLASQKTELEAQLAVSVSASRYLVVILTHFFCLKVDHKIRQNQNYKLRYPCMNAM